MSQTYSHTTVKSFKCQPVFTKISGEDLNIHGAADNNSFDPDSSMLIKWSLEPAVHHEKPTTTGAASNTSSCDHT